MLTGQEVVQVYIRDLVFSSLRPFLELEGFAKLVLEPGESRTVSIKPDRDALKFYDEKRKWRVAEKGELEVLVGSTLRDLKHKVTVSLRTTIIWNNERDR
jgi:beta-glucosidase